MSSPTQDNAMLNEFKTWLESRDASGKSIRAYLSDARHFMAWFEQATGEAFSPAAADWRDLQDWRNQAEKDFQPATVNRRISSLKTFFAFALEKGLAATDPTRRLKGVEQHLDGRRKKVGVGGVAKYSSQPDESTMFIAPHPLLRAGCRYPTRGTCRALVQ